MIGKLTVITGPMRSGKTLELIRLVSVLEAQDKKVIIFKPDIDNRVLDDSVKEESVQSRFGISKAAESLNFSFLIINKSKDFDVIAIDEGHLWDDSLYTVVTMLLKDGKDIIISGLVQDHRSLPFFYMQSILAIADDIIFLKAVCSKCKEYTATKTKRVDGKNDMVIEVGDSQYESLCTKCW